MSLLMTLKQRAKDVALAVAPGPAQRLRDRRNRQRDAHVADIARQLGEAVCTGPFTGMRFANMPRRRQPLPKIVGSYEEELAGVTELLIAREPDVVVDIGCGEGYYVVGFALRLRAARVHAYDTDPVAQQLTTRLAQENGVADRVQVDALCTPERLAQLASVARRPLVIVDIEGGEVDLLREPTALARADLVVELHDFIDPAISRTVLGRFRQTHAPSVIRTRPRRPEDYPHLAALAPEDRRLALDECRPAPMEWLVAVAHR